MGGNAHKQQTLVSKGVKLWLAKGGTRSGATHDMGCNRRAKSVSDQPSRTATLGSEPFARVQKTPGQDSVQAAQGSAVAAEVQAG